MLYRSLIGAALAMALAVPSPAAAGEAPVAEAAKGKSRTCGTKLIYGKTLTIRERGDLISCRRVMQITAGGCRDRRIWACFSFQSPAPLLVWFRAKERFKPKLSLLIEGLRYPCTDAVVTSQAWTTAQTVGQSKFPTYEQVLTDDLIRCGQLVGLSRDQVTALLGPPDFRSTYQGSTFLDYDIGPERDSFFQIDSEVLSVEIGPSGFFTRAEIYQS